MRRMDREGFTTAERVRASRRYTGRVCPAHFTRRTLFMCPRARAYHAETLEGAAVYRRWVATMRNPLEANRRARGLASAREQITRAAQYRDPDRGTRWAPLP